MEPIEVQLIPERSYTVKCGDTRLEGMRVTGVWEGMTRLNGADGQVLILEPLDGPMAGAFKELLSEVGLAADYPRCSVIKGSPELLTKLVKSQNCCDQLPAESRSSGSRCSAARLNAGTT